MIVLPKSLIIVVGCIIWFMLLLFLLKIGQAILGWPRNQDAVADGELGIFWFISLLMGALPVGVYWLLEAAGE